MNDKKILFLYHIKEREYAICKIIKAEILKINRRNKVLIVNFESQYNIAFNFIPDIIITFPPRGEWVADTLTTLKVAFNPTIISMTTEGLHTFESSMVKIMVGHNKYSEKLVDYYIYWGPKIAAIQGEELKRGNKITDMKRIKIFGYVMYETEKIQEYFSNFQIVKKLEENRKKYKKMVLWATGFMGADEGIEDMKNGGCFEHRHGKSYQIEKEYAQTKINSAIKYREKYVYHINKLAEDNEEILFIVKLHPNEVNSILYNKKNAYKKLQGIPNILIIEKSMPIGILLPYIDTFVHYGSTTGIEAYIYNVPTIQITALPEKYPYTEYGKVFFPATKLVDIDSHFEIKEAIEEELLFEEIEEIDAFIYGIFNYKKGNEYHPSTEMANFICGNMEHQCITKVDKYAKKILEGSIGLNVRKILYTKLLKDFQKLNFKAVIVDVGMLCKLLKNIKVLLNDICLLIKKG